MADGIHILYVDDEPGLLEIGRLFLEQSGRFIVDTITSAPEALALLNTRNYDAIISDYQMPDMDGIEFLRRVRRSGNTIPFILFTGRGREEVVIQALNEGADFYLQKGGEPVSQFTELAHQVHHAVQQRMAEHSIRDLERREADIINFLPDATFAIDRSGHIIAWNRAIEEMTGVSAEEMLGKGDYEYAIPFYGERRPILIDLIFEPDEVIIKNYSHVVHDRNTLIADTTLPHPKGKPVTLMGKASPLYNRQGGIVGAIESIRDISEMKRAEENLHESEQQFVAFMDHLPVTAFIKDDHFTNIFVNRYMEEIFGAKEWVGKTAPDLFPKEVAEKMTEDDRQTLQDGFRKNIENLTTINGDTKIFETYKFRIDRVNKPPLIGGFAVDITDQKRAEVTIQESEERYRNVVEDQTEFISRFLPDGTHVFVNEAYCRYFGLKRDEILGHRFRPKTPFEDRVQIKKFFESLTPENPVDNIEHRIIMPDGNIRWQWWSDRAIFDQDGNVLEYQSVGRDITEQKKTEIALTTSQGKLAEAMDITHLANWEFDEQTGIFTFDDRFYSLYGTTATREGGYQIPAEVYFREFVHPDDRDRVIREVQSGRNISDLHGVWQIEHRIIRRDGEVRHIVVRLERPGNSGRIIKTHGVNQDVTESKRAEEALRESEDRYHRLISYSFDAVIVHQDGRIVLANDAAARIIGSASAGELVGRPLLDCVHPEFRENVAKRIQQIQHSPEKPAMPLIEEKFVRDDGTSVDVEVMAIATQHEGCPAIMVVFRDIDERKRAEADLKEREETFRSLVSESSDGIVITDEQGMVIVWNDALARITGIPCEEAVGSLFSDIAFSELVPEHKGPGQLARIRSTIETVLCTGQSEFFSSHMDAEIIRRDGVHRYIQQTGFPIHTAMGFRIGAIIRDITEYRQADEVLRKSEAHLKRAEEIGRSGSWEFRFNENAVIGSEGARVLYGLEGTQWTIDDVKTVPLPEYRPLLDAAMRDLISGKSPYDVEFRIRRWSDGALLDIHSLAEYDPGRNAVFGVIQDITGRKLSEDLSRKTQDRLETLISNLNAGVIMVSDDGIIEHVNQALCDLYQLPDSPESLSGLSSEEMINKIQGAYVSPSESFARIRRKTLQGMPVKGDEITLRDGRIAMVDFIPIVDQSGRRRGRIWHHQDITKLKRAEEELLQANNKLKLMSSITRHDITNQLTLIRGYLSLLEKNPSGTLFKEYAGKITTAAERITTMIQFTKKYEEIGVHDPVWQDCRNLIDTAIKQVPPGKVVVENDVPASRELFADPLIVKVWYNLIDNAVRHGETATTVRFSVEESGENHVILCEDDGEGIPVHNKEKIFDREFGRNTGLGLFLSREILAITGITIKETGEPGRGARFEITVPKGACRVNMNADRIKP
jgi:PAS domain S-box-containing protein